MQKPTRKYLERRAEPEVETIRACPPAVWRESPLQFGHVLVIPVFSEGENLFDTLASIPPGPQGPVLVIVVVNGNPHSTKEDLELNQWTLLQFEKRFPRKTFLSSNPPLSLHKFPVGNLLIVDRSSPGFLFPEKEGVGLARKIGCDLALVLHAKGQIQSPWIHTTDADVILPSDYFEGTEKITDKDVSALLYPFHHQGAQDSELSEAARLYEIHLRYYVAGLEWAGSPYAFHTIGSTLAIRASSYAAVGGFPRRMAGEDFYLLNKLAKVGRVHSLSGLPIQIEGRLSDRVPFGTGMALHKILKDQEDGKGFCLYHPQTFNHLKFWLSFINELSEKYDKNLKPLWTKQIQKAPPSLSLKSLETLLQKMEAFEAIEEAASRSSTPTTLRRHLHTWFDAFRTLKFVHGLRDQGLSSIPWEEACSIAPFFEIQSPTQDYPPP